MNRQNLLRVAGVLLAAILLSGWACQKEDFERNAWVTLRDADAAIESATQTYEEWKADAASGFTAKELELMRQTLFTANEALSAGESAFTAYRHAQRVFAAGTGSQADLEAAEENLRQALDAVTRAIAAVRAIVKEYSEKSEQQSQVSPQVLHAGVPIPLLMILISLLGEFAAAILGGKKARITTAAIKLVAAVFEVHQKATGEEIDLELPALRERIADRRKRLSK